MVYDEFFVDRLPATLHGIGVVLLIILFLLSVPWLRNSCRKVRRLTSWGHWLKPAELPHDYPLEKGKTGQAYLSSF